MTPKTILLALIILVAAVVNIGAQQGAENANEKRIVLNSDGTWQYLSAHSVSLLAEDRFLKATWGMNKEEVKKLENSMLIEEKDDILLFKGQVLNLDTYIGYIFANDRLVKSKWVIEQTFKDKNDYIDSYLSLKSALIEQYGEPGEDEQPWRNDLYANEHQHWGFAISLGHMFYFSNWDTNDTVVKLLLKGENFKIKLSISFTGKNLRFAGEDEEGDDVRAAMEL